MGTIIELVTVLLIFLCVISTFYPEDLHSILIYFFRCNVPKYDKEFKPYYIVSGIISGLTAYYFYKVLT